MNQTDPHGEVLKLVIGWIGDESAFMKRAFQQSEEFQSLCQDYVECRKALQRWKLSKSELAETRHEEYIHLLDELDLEIRTWLKDAQARNG